MSRAPQLLDIFRNYLILTSFKLLGFSACRKASLLECPSGTQSPPWYFVVPAGKLAGSLCQQPR